MEFRGGQRSRPVVYLPGFSFGIGRNSRGNVFSMVTEIRKLSARERDILERMFSQLPDAGGDLSKQLKDVKVSVIDQDGSVRFLINSSERASCISDRVPVTAIFDDDDGVPIYLLLHIVDGRLSELEVYKADGSQIITRPEAAKLYF
jgi:hypothetical protein